MNWRVRGVLTLVAAVLPNRENVMNMLKRLGVWIAIVVVALAVMAAAAFGSLHGAIDDVESELRELRALIEAERE